MNQGHVCACMRPPEAKKVVTRDSVITGQCEFTRSPVSPTQRICGIFAMLSVYRLSGRSVYITKLAIKQISVNYVAYNFKVA